MLEPASILMQHAEGHVITKGSQESGINASLISGAKTDKLPITLLNNEGLRGRWT